MPKGPGDMSGANLSRLRRTRVPLLRPSHIGPSEGPPPLCRTPFRYRSPPARSSPDLQPGPRVPQTSECDINRVWPNFRNLGVCFSHLSRASSSWKCFKAVSGTPPLSSFAPRATPAPVPLPAPVLDSTHPPPGQTTPVPVPSPTWILTDPCATLGLSLCET